MGDIIRPSQREDLAGKSPQEAYAILKEEGVELTDEKLEGIAGGGWTYTVCRYCGASVSADADWCPECDEWLGEGDPPNFAPAKERR